MRDGGDFFDLDEAWTPAADLWYRARVLEWLYSLADDTSGQWRVLQSKEARTEICRWFVRQRERFVGWLPTVEFDPAREANGAWVLRPNAMGKAISEEAIPEYEESEAQHKETQQYTSLDSWLLALSQGKILAKGPQEPCLKRELKWKSEERQERWPRQCRACSESFLPDRRNAVRCDDCLKNKRRVS